MAARTAQKFPALNKDNALKLMTERKTTKENPLSWEDAGKAFGVDKIVFRDFLDTVDPEGVIFDGMPMYVWPLVVETAPPIKRGPGRPRKNPPAAPAQTVDTTPTAPVVSSQKDTENKETKMETKITGAWVNDGGETHFTKHVPGTPATGHMLLEIPEFIPAPPEGVNANMWELYQAAETRPAREFWGKKVAEQMKAHALAVLESEKQTEPENNPDAPFGVDPVTGEAYAF